VRGILHLDVAFGISVLPRTLVVVGLVIVAPQFFLTAPLLLALILVLIALLFASLRPILVWIMLGVGGVLLTVLPG
jgi:hypothetical protein